MDVMMPELDGYATMNKIRQMPAFAALPIIAVTARAMPGDKEKSIAAGASDYVTKPVDTDELLACMERWLDRAITPRRPSGLDKPAAAVGGGSRTPPAPPVALPVLGGGAAPDAVVLIVRQRELQAFLPHAAARADVLAARSALGRAGRRKWERTSPGRPTGKRPADRQFWHSQSRSSRVLTRS
jgi:CheY-like chemotaxis protein